MSADSITSPKTIELPSRGSFPYSVRKSEKAKRPLVRLLRQGRENYFLTPFEIEVVLPKYQRHEMPEKLIEEAAGWIEKQVEKWTRRESQRLKPFQMLYQGRPYSLVEKTSDLFNAKAGVFPEGDFLSVVSEGAPAEEWFERWVNETAASALRASLEEKMASMKVRPKGFYLRTQSSIWGSCSHLTKMLSLNRKLIMAPPECLEYVVVHELAHLVHRGHGERFWNLVGRHCRKPEESRQWLVENGWRMVFPREIVQDGQPRLLETNWEGSRSFLVEL